MTCWKVSGLYQSMTDAILSRLEGHASDDHPFECVGLLLEDGNTIRLRNQARSRHRFFVNPEQFADIIDEFTAPVSALYHSHIDKPSIPSDEDKRMMFYLSTVWPDAYHIILSPFGHHAYDVVGDGIVNRELPWS